jgi:hypothetical protein
MPYFEVPGASLHYETVGNGPVLLCITGAGGAEFWRAFAEHLKDQFTVVTYDRMFLSLLSEISTKLKSSYAYWEQVEGIPRATSQIRSHKTTTIASTRTQTTQLHF